MRIKLVIDGADERVRITPESKFDEVLLEYIAQWDKASVNTHRKKDQMYSNDRTITSIDLILEMETSGEVVGVPNHFPIA